MQEFEVWHDIPGFPNYEICSDAVIRKKRLVPKGTKDLIVSQSCGSRYYGVKLKHESGTWKRVHVHCLMMLVFVGPRPEGLVINHIDGDKSNNLIENLEYCTQMENERHSIKTLGKIHTRDKHGRFITKNSTKRLV